jgi:hypothetical protein
LKRGARILAALACGLATAGATGPVAVTFREVEKPLLLAPRVLGEPASGFREAQTEWNPGVAQWSSVTIYFARAPQPTRFSGLCRVELAYANLTFEEPRTETSGLFLGERAVEHLYALEDIAPTFGAAAPANANRCRRLPPFLNRRIWQLTEVRTGAGEATPVEAVFAYRAILAARAGAGAASAQCADTGELACTKPRAFLGQLDPRSLVRLKIAACEGERLLCIAADVANEAGSATLHIDLRTASTTAAAGPVTVSSVRITFWPAPVF